MHFSFYHRYIISSMLSTGLVFGPCVGFQIESLDCLPPTADELGLESLGLDSAYKKLLKPVKELTPSSGRKNMIDTALTYMANLKKLTGSRMQINDGIYHMAACFQHYGVPYKENKMKAFSTMLHNPQKLSPDTEEFYIDFKKNGKKEFGNIDDMTDAEIQAYVWVFCGCLMMMIPNGICQGLGGGLVVSGVQQIMSIGGGKE